MEKITLTSQENISDFIELLNATAVWGKLQDKTQVFNNRIVDAVKSRGSHSIDVGEIAAELASGLTSDRVIIEKARLLGRLHDIGHIPFGHAGESIAAHIVETKFKNFSDEQKRDIEVIRKCLFGEKYAEKNTKPGFEHNENSVLQYHMLSQELGYQVDPELVEGILSHSTSRYPDLPMTLVQQAVRLADKIAYINYDTQDLQLSFEGKEEWEALKQIYSRPILDSENQATVISYDGKTYHNILEFLEGLEVSDRISIFISEAVKMAETDKAKSNPQYAGYQTILTGGNDIIVELSNLKKNEKYYNGETKQWTQEGIAEKKRLKQTLMDKSPILYLAYEMKERSDEFIRAGTGLSLESKKERSKNAKSAVGNEDLKNQYIYNKLVAFLEKRHQIEIDKLPESLQTIFNNFFREYDKYKSREESIIGNLPGNDQHVQYPEIYTILNFIGSHSNTDLIELSKSLGIDVMFEKEVLPEIRVLIENEQYFDKSKQTFTKAGQKERDKIVDKYGAYITFTYGIDENDFTPTTSEDVIEESKQYGYREEKDNTPSSKTMEVTSEPAKQEDQKDKIEQFQKQDKSFEQSLLQGMTQHVELQQSQVLEGSNIRHGR